MGLFLSEGDYRFKRGFMELFGGFFGRRKKLQYEVLALRYEGLDFSPFF